ncbi:MAG: ABC transporter permease [bacterium]|nr:ABC transporter permease [bacterium]
MVRRANIVRAVGRRVISLWTGGRNFYRFIVSIVVSFKSFRYLRFRSIYTIVINQTRFTGIDALPFVLFIALLIGGTVIIQAMTNLPKFGIEGFLGNLLVIIVARELGPLATALIVISRSGSAITAEIATQKQNREILSMEIMGIDTRLYIVFPRIMASIISLFSLMIFFDIVAFFGGYLISQVMTIHIPIDEFARTLMESFSIEDLAATVLKSLIYGIFIPLVCCYYGFMPKSKFEIPIYVSRAVIRTLAFIFVINALISVWFYL